MTARNRYRVDEAKAQMRDKIGSDKLEVETEDGTVFEIEHPMFRSAATKKALRPLEDDDADGIAQVVFGDRYDEWVDHGGDAEELAYIFWQVGQDTKDALAGKKRPTRSSAS